MPRKPYRSPREWLQADQRGLFGTRRTDTLNWRAPTSSLEGALLAAAQQQNSLASHIRANMTYHVATSAVAGFADLHPDTVRDILNGSKHATLAVLHALTAALGMTLTIGTTKVTEASSTDSPPRMTTDTGSPGQT